MNFLFTNTSKSNIMQSFLFISPNMMNESRNYQLQLRGSWTNTDSLNGLIVVSSLHGLVCMYGNTQLRPFLFVFFRSGFVFYAVLLCIHPAHNHLCKSIQDNLSLTCPFDSQEKKPINYKTEWGREIQSSTDSMMFPHQQRCLFPGPIFKTKQHSPKLLNLSQSERTFTSS